MGEELSQQVVRGMQPGTAASDVPEGREGEGGMGRVGWKVPY